MRDTTAKGEKEWVKDSVFAASANKASYCPSTRDVSMSLPLKRLEASR